MAALSLGIELEAVKRTRQPVTANPAFAQRSPEMGTAIQVGVWLAIGVAPEDQPPPKALDTQRLMPDFTTFKNRIPVGFRQTHRSAILIVGVVARAPVVCGAPSI